LGFSHRSKGFFASVDFQDSFEKTNLHEILTMIALATVILLVGTFASATRLNYGLTLFNLPVGLDRSWMCTQYGGFYSHTPLSFIGGDAVKLGYLVNLGHPTAVVASALLLDRFIGLVALVLATAILTALLSVMDPGNDFYTVAFLLVFIALVAVTLAFCVSAVVKRFSPRSHLVNEVFGALNFTAPIMRSPNVFLKILIMSLVIHILAVASFLIPLLLIDGMLIVNIEVTLKAFWGFVIAYLSSLLPVSFAGWGVREATLLMLLDKSHFGHSEVLICSVIYGISNLFSLSVWAILPIFKLAIDSLDRLWKW
jgi:hypothetical protein